MTIIDRFRLLHLRRLRRNPVRAAVSIIGIASGVGLVVAMASLLTSSEASARAAVAVLGGASHEVTVPGPGLSRAEEAVAAIEGVEETRRLVEVPVIVDDVQAWLLALEAAPGYLDTAEARALAATTGLRSGSALPTSGSHRITGFTGVQTETAIEGPVEPILADRFGGRFVAADLDTALALRGPTGTETILVYGDVDTAELRAALGDGQVAATSDRVAQARNSLELIFVSLSVLGAMGLVVGGFLVFNTMNMAVLERRHELASLRALGSDRRSILVGVLAEATLLGAIGSALGLVLGAVMASSVIASVPDAYTRAIGTPLQTSVPASLLVTAWIIGVATAAVSSIGPARRALRVEPLDALRPDAADLDGQEITGRVWLIAVGVALTVAPIGQLSAATAMAGLLCVAIGAAPFITKATVAVASAMGASGELAATSLRRAPRRVWGTTTAVLVAVAIAVATAGMADNIITTTNENLTTTLESDYWIGTTTGDTIALTGLPASWTAELDRTPGVSSVAASSWIPVESGEHLVGIQGVYGDSAYPFSRLADDEARQTMSAGDGAIVLKQTALTFDLAVGDLIELPGATPPLELPVVAITEAISPTSGGMINISHERLAAHYGVETFARYEVVLEPGADPDAVRAELDRITGPAGPSIQTYRGSEFLSQLQQSTDQMGSLITAVMVVIVVCAAIAVLNTLLASTLERTSEIAALRAIGATKRRIVTSIAAESLAIAVTGAVLGAVAGSVNHAIVVRTYWESTPFDVDYAFRPSLVGTAIVLGVVIATAGAVLPCRRSVRLNILEALAR